MLISFDPASFLASPSRLPSAEILPRRQIGLLVTHNLLHSGRGLNPVILISMPYAIRPPSALTSFDGYNSRRGGNAIGACWGGIFVGVNKQKVMIKKINHAIQALVVDT